MNLKECREQLYTIEEEIIINKKVIIRGTEVTLLAFTKGNLGNRLWILYKIDSKKDDLELLEMEEEEYLGDFVEDYDYINDNDFEDNVFEDKTNREDLIEHIKESENIVHIQISQMEIQNQVINFESSSAGPVEYFNNFEYIILNYFINKGLISSEWDEVDLRDMVIGVYEQKEEESFPNIKKEEDLDISLIISEEMKEVLLQHPFKVSLKKYKQNEKITYINEEKQEEYFYINEVFKDDIWKNTLEELNSNLEKIELDLIEKEEIIKNYTESLEAICPKNMDMLTIAYENENNIQLRFLTKEYLEAVPEYSSSSTTFIMSYGDEKGINGYNKWADHLSPVEKDFNCEIEIELFSKYMKIKEETIIV